MTGSLSSSTFPAMTGRCLPGALGRLAYLERPVDVTWYAEA